MFLKSKVTILQNNNGAKKPFESTIVTHMCRE